MENESDESRETLNLLVSQEAKLVGSIPTSFAAGRYKVQRLIGHGGQKQVYLARDTHLDRDVVISLLKTEQLDQSSVARLRREAQTMGRLAGHPHIVTVHDIGEEGGRPYIVSEYIEGGSVADLLKRSDKNRLPLEEATRIAEQVCQSLAYAHSQGIVHRDLKPANVWLTQDRKAMLGDFGLAVGLDLSRITTEGVIVGTALYMSPEQILGRQAEPQSD